MNELERRFVSLLRFYPKSYRDERGDEIVATMVEASPAGRPSLGDAVNVMAHGLRMRVGLMADGFIGQSLSLSALPGLMMAAALAVVFTIGDWSHGTGPRPSGMPPFMWPHFGPFATFGPIVYMVWVIGAVIVHVRASWMRWIALGCELTTLTAIAIDGVTTQHPPVLLLLMLFGLGLPAVVAPAQERFGRRGSLLVGLLIFGALWAYLSVSSGLTRTGPYPTIGTYFYVIGVRHLAVDFTPVLLIAGALLIATALALHKPVVGGAIAILMLPWAILAGKGSIGYYSAVPPFTSVTTLIVGVLIVGWLTVGWHASQRGSTNLGEL